MKKGKNCPYAKFRILPNKKLPEILGQKGISQKNLTVTHLFIVVVVCGGHGAESIYLRATLP